MTWPRRALTVRWKGEGQTLQNIATRDNGRSTRRSSSLALWRHHVIGASFRRGICTSLRLQIFYSYYSYKLRILLRYIPNNLWINKSCILSCFCRLHVSHHVIQSDRVLTSDPDLYMTLTFHLRWAMVMNHIHSRSRSTVIRFKRRNGNRRSDGRMEPIALPSSLTRLVKITNITI